MPAKFTRLIRFRDPKGHVHYGEAGDQWQQDITGKQVSTYDITTPYEANFQLSGKEAEVAEVGLSTAVWSTPNRD